MRYLFLFASFFAMIAPSLAEQDTDKSIPSNIQLEKKYLENWQEDKARLQKMTAKEFCHERWSILWYWAKQGNLEARHLLLILVAPPPDMSPMLMPNEKGDTISRLRNVLIMGVHSIDYQGDDSSVDTYKNLTVDLFRQFQLDRSRSGKKFLECVKIGEEEMCSQVAVKENIIPSFEDYSSNIDAVVETGSRSQCN